MGSTRRKILRAKARKSRAERMSEVKGPCSRKNCDRRAKIELHCKTCDDLAVQKGRKLHSVKACREHGEWAIAKIKRHSLVAHPLNLLRATTHALGGGTFE